jgi:hypothetical protein
MSDWKGPTMPIQVRKMATVTICALVLAAGCGGGGSDGLGGSSVPLACSDIPLGTGPAVAAATPASTCQTRPTTAPGRLSWVANRETAVNSSGGGYRVYRGSTPGFDVTAASPWVAVPSSETSVQLSGLTPGVHYLKVVAFSPGGNASAPSAEVCVRLQ